MHNIFYLPEDISALPRAIFSLTSIREKSLFNAVRQRVERDMPIAESDLRQLASFSHLVAEFIVSGWLSLREIDVALERPAHRFDVLMENYRDLAARIEGPLERDFESVERLVAYFRFSNQTALHPDDHYRRLLRGDPERYYRLFPDADKDDLDTLLGDTIAKKNTSPEHAYFFVQVNQLSVLEGELQRCLQKSDQHAYRAALLLRKNNAAPETVESLLAGLTSPRWIYHTLKSGLVEPTDQLLVQLSKNPGWAVEWLVHRRAPTEEVDMLYARCKLNAERHANLHDLDLWFQRRVIARVRPPDAVPIPG